MDYTSIVFFQQPVLLRMRIHHRFPSFSRNTLAFWPVYIPRCNVAEVDGNSVVLGLINLFLLGSVIVTLVDIQVFKQPPDM